MRLLLSFLFPLILTISCVSQNSNENILPCSERCDSIHYVKEGEIEVAHVYYQGVPQGPFYLKQDSRIVYGFKELIGPYIKETRFLSDSLTLVGIHDGYEVDDQFKEFVWYDSEDIDNLLGHYFRFEHDSIVFFQEYAQMGEFDTIYFTTDLEQKFWEEKWHEVFFKTSERSFILPRVILDYLDSGKLVYVFFVSQSEGSYSVRHMKLTIDRVRRLDFLSPHPHFKF